MAAARIYRHKWVPVKLPIALVVIVVVLVFKPAGLFGRVVVSRV